MGALKKLGLLLKARGKYPPYKDWDEATVHQWENIRKGYVYEREREIFARLRKGYSERVLDLACGSGRYTEMFECRDYVGVDFSSAMLRLAKKRYPEAHFVLADAFCLPFRDGVFDEVFACRFIHHYTDLFGFYCEVRRILSANGVFVFDLTHKLSIPYVIARLLRITLYAKNKSEFIAEYDSILSVVDSVEFFFLPSILYSLMSRLVSGKIDDLFSRFLPTRSFCVATKKVK